MSGVVFSTEVGFDWIDKGKIFNLCGVKSKIFTLGCEARCVSLMEFESLIQPKAGAILLCGLDLIDIGVGIGRKRVLMIHEPCEVKTANTVLRIPESITSLPSLVKVRGIPYALQELGGGARVRVIYGGEPRVYLLITPSQASLSSKDREIIVPPEPVLLATPSGSELRFGNLRLKLP